MKELEKPLNGVRVLAASIMAFALVCSSPTTLVGARGISPGLHGGFEGFGFPPPGWTATGNGTLVPHTWHRTTDPLYVAKGVGAALVNGGFKGPIDEWLLSPMFLVTAADSTLRF